MSSDDDDLPLSQYIKKSKQKILKTDLETERNQNPLTPENFLNLVPKNIPDPSIKLNFEFQDTSHIGSPSHTGTIPKRKIPDDLPKGFGIQSPFDHLREANLPAFSPTL